MNYFIFNLSAHTYICVYKMTTPVTPRPVYRQFQTVVSTYNCGTPPPWLR